MNTPIYLRFIPKIACETAFPNIFSSDLGPDIDTVLHRKVFWQSSNKYHIFKMPLLCAEVSSVISGNVSLWGKKATEVRQSRRQTAKTPPQLPTSFRRLAKGHLKFGGSFAVWRKHTFGCGGVFAIWRRGIQSSELFSPFGDAQVELAGGILLQE